ncbi:MAG: phospholipase, partial [Tepidisphaeraceae bacterium]
MNSLKNPHAHQPVVTRGPAPEIAAATLIMIHGRGASAESMLGLWDALAIPELAAIAPQAAGGT